MKGIGILPGDHISYIDHLVPLCQIMQIPILVTEQNVADLIEFYYPPQEILCVEPENYSLDPFLEPYDVFFYVDYFRKGHGSFQFKEFLAQKKARSVMSLHGNPDKFSEIYWIEHLGDEDVVLAYGPQLIELMQKKAVKTKPLSCGNYRLEYYKEREAFFDAKVPFKKEKTTLLYAPTWSYHSRDIELKADYSTFFDVYKHVFDTLSEKYQLIVKLHPFLFSLMPDEMREVQETYPHIFFLDNFPLIYPLLKQIDLYVGDYSSVGYDFLYFDRPLFFLETQRNTPLQECGKKICKEELSSLETFDGKKKERKELYTYAFGERKELHQLKKEIEDACRYPASKS